MLDESNRNNRFHDDSLSAYCDKKEEARQVLSGMVLDGIDLMEMQDKDFLKYLQLKGHARRMELGG